MATVELHFEREVEFSPAIVWDALVDDDLVSGWLAEATITAELGGDYVLAWTARVGRPVVPGRITVFQPHRALEVDTATSGRLRFDLREVPGGSRGTSTALTLTVGLDIEPAFSARVRADWMTTLDQLEDVLHGHPVDWEHWDRDRHEAWSHYFAEAGG